MADGRGSKSESERCDTSACTAGPDPGPDRRRSAFSHHHADAEDEAADDRGGGRDRWQ